MTNLKNLLVIASRYPHHEDKISTTFVYSQVEELKKYFDRVLVIATTPYVPPFLTNLMQPKRKADARARDYSYDNVDVFFTRTVFLPKDMLILQRGKQAYKKTRKILERERFEPNIIHAHFIWPSGFIGMNLKKQGYPLVITGHGYDVYDLPFRNKSIKKVIIKTLKEADRVITVSNSNMRIMVDKLEVDKNRIKIIPNGYDSKLFRIRNKMNARKKAGIPPDKKIVVSVGNLHEVKGFKYLIRSINEIADKDMLCYIIGDGPEKENLKNEIEKNSLQHRVYLKGYRPHDEISYWINAADVFVLPSLSEGNPTVMFEALGSGRPFVGTDVGGVKDIISGEEFGYVVKPKDPKKMAEALKKALTRSWDEKRIHEHSKQYTWKNIGRSIIDTYKEVLEEK